MKYKFYGSLILLSCLFFFSLNLVAQQMTLGTTLARAQGWNRVNAQQKLIDIVVQGDPAILNSKKEPVVVPFLKNKNQAIIQYLTSKYPQYGVPQVDKDDVATVWFGLICAMYEANGFKPLKDIRLNNLASQGLPAWFTCTLGVLGASYGIGELMGSLGNFSYATVWKMVKFVVKKYVVGWLATAVALYEIANECF